MNGKDNGPVAAPSFGQGRLGPKFTENGRCLSSQLNNWSGDGEKRHQSPRLPRRSVACCYCPIPSLPQVIPPHSLFPCTLYCICCLLLPAYVPEPAWDFPSFSARKSRDASDFPCHRNPRILVVPTGNWQWIFQPASLPISKTFPLSLERSQSLFGDLA